MSTTDRSQIDRRVVLAATPDEVEALRAWATDLEIIAATPAQFARWAVDRHPRVAAWATDDPAAGLAALAAVHTARSVTRRLLLTPAEAEAERVAALEAGVDEVVSRPLGPIELAARLRSLLRRGRRARRSRLPIGDGIELDLDRRELLRDERWVHLRPKEAQLLELFARQPGRVLTREHILERVWGADHDGDPRTIDVHVRWLRAKLEPDPHRPVWLLTVRGTGYRLETLPLTER